MSDDRSTSCADHATCGDDATSPHFGIDRRRLLKTAGVASLAMAVATATDAAAPREAQALGTGVLVVVNLRGGVDGLTMVPPVGDPDYARARPGIAVPQSAALSLGHPVFGLHPQLAPLLPHWKAQRLAVVPATGCSLLGSRSHFDAIAATQQAVFGASAARTGWLDRALSVIGASTVYGGVTIGNATPSAMIGPRPTLTMSSVGSFHLDVWDDVEPAYRIALRALHQHSGPVSSTAASNVAALSSVAAAAAKTTTAANGAVYPAGELGAKLRDVARVLRGGIPLRVAFVEVGGYDVHSAHGAVGSGTMTTLLGQLAKSLAAFATDIGPTLLARTTIVTTSEFGRRVAENASGGTDHGRGNTMLLLGGGVNGGVHGAWPGLGPAALDRGDVAVRTDYRDVLAEVLTDRFGFGAGGLATVFPGLTHRPLGLLRAT